MFSIKNLLALSVAGMFATGAAFAQDTPSTDATTKPKKEGVGGKMKNGAETVGTDTKKGAEAVVKDTEGGVKAVGRGTKKVVTGTGHEVGKLTHIGHKKAKTDSAAASNAASTTPPAAK